MSVQTNRKQARPLNLLKESEKKMDELRTVVGQKSCIDRAIDILRELLKIVI